MSLSVIGGSAPRELDGLLVRHGYRVLRLPRNPQLPPAVADHPDLSVFFASDAVYTTKGYASLAKDELNAVCAAIGRPLRIVTGECGATYPQDVLLDALPLGGLLFCLPHATAPELTAHPAYQTVPVRQGYAKCAALPVGDRALASADPSILHAAERHGLETLPLRAGGIRLPGYDTGFIGGAASFAPYGGSDTVFFCGNLAGYPDGDRLERFLAAHGFKILDLPMLPLTDIGTVFLFSEE